MYSEILRRPAFGATPQNDTRELGFRMDPDWRSDAAREHTSLSSPDLWLGSFTAKCWDFLDGIPPCHESTQSAQ